MTTTTSSEILHHTTAFISETLSQPDLRHRLFTFLSSRIPPSDQTTLKPLHLAAQTLENAISTASTTNSSLQSSSLCLAQTLLLSHPETPLSSFLLSLIHSLGHQPINASTSLLHIFFLEPSLARSEIAPVLFEELFLVHLLPVLEWLNEQRATILSSSSTNLDYDNDDDYSLDVSVEVPCAKLLSKMNGNQALELKELERSYEEVLDENCRVLVNYFKEVLENNDRNGLISPPPVVLKKIDKGDLMEYSTEDEKIKMEEFGLKNRRYNVILHLLSFSFN